MIEPTKTEWVAPTIRGLKKDKTLLFCVNYCKLKTFTIQELYLVRHTDDYIDSVGEQTVFWKQDATSSCWQIKIEGSFKDRSALKSNHGFYSFIRMPVGLCNF